MHLLLLASSLALVPQPSSTLELDAHDNILLHEAVALIYDRLPKEHRNLIDRGLVFKFNRSEPQTSTAFGWGPEDDEDYRYPDQTVYPAGTIKVNLSLQTLELMELRRRVNSRLEGDVRGILQRIFTHEIEHALQYTRRPVRSLMTPADCPKGRCDPDLIQGTREKIEYEFAALELGYEESWRQRPNYESTAEYFRNHGELLPPRIQNLSNWLSSWAFEMEGVSTFNRKFYGAKYEIPELADQYWKQLSNPKAAEKLKSRVQDYFDFNCKGEGHLVRSAPYLEPVFIAILGGARSPA